MPLPKPSLMLLPLAALVAGCAIQQAKPPPRDWVRSVPEVVGPVAYGEQVRALAGGDFAERAKAAETLVAAGENALPALAAAGDLPVALHGGKAEASSTRAVVRAILETLPTDRLVASGLSSPGAGIRRAAAEEAGRRADRAAMPALTVHLADPDAEVRVAARTALARLADVPAAPPETGALSKARVVRRS